ncbi:Ubiquitin and WLM domain-containing metalloprotease [Golovinomyces cichoracearum]|uniref:Ubiquitin and WLM domain-containing metalloprotease n=1 Tax=Golovinomyces cichoracearum TaxID=62708 RepID=A0A420HTN4_9PEZI|nr:Ubiquitin and WLM domain-containing metalloprotease [Golovinomyces cichoracearum]
MAHPEFDSSRETQTSNLTATGKDESQVSISFTHHGNKHTFSFSSNASISDLSNEIYETLHIPPLSQKFMISRIGLLKPPFRNPELLLSSIARNKITLMGSTVDEISSISVASEEAARRVNRRAQPLQKATAYKNRNWKKEREESQYTFLELRPLSYLPNPSRSLQLLQRLKDDAGIKFVMCKHKFTVPLLTEMNTIEHTQSNHEGTSRTLGLNRNNGEIIELRLRTDAYDGYRDYQTIRRTLCHELTHNVHGPHNRDFWELCSQIEKDVERADWRSGGILVGGTETYQNANEVVDQHAWTGGEYLLGANSKENGTPSSDRSSSRRQIIAKAAEERMNQQQRDRSDDYTKNK